MLCKIGTYDICDGTLAGGVAISTLSYQVDRQIEIVVPLDALDPDTLDRGGRKLTVSFTVYRTHANASAAEAFIVGLDVALPSSGDVELTFTDFSTTYLIPNAKVVRHDSRQNGATTITNYMIVGGRGTGSGSGSGSGSPVAKVLKADGTAADAYLDKILGVDQGEVWITYQVAIPAATLSHFVSTSAGDFSDLFGTTQAVMTMYGASLWHVNGFGGGDTGGVPVADTWTLIEVHSISSSDFVELFVDTVSIASYDGTSAEDSHEFLIGQYNGTIDTGPNIVYFKQVKVGTTRGGSEILSEDFSGDLSAWSVTGDCTIVDDPY